ncbi:histidine kinase internal region (plasmid) [Gemmatirosa kalamazoonensis]|uniref:Histidine kinase internal region n=2 Tax=Gemmatirosa kalamazoonensis TaxID=861299 RepID=W0RSU5_9BACT|nr:histidine kinase internal region [Gemmatirosa kalamazoonensis]
MLARMKISPRLRATLVVLAVATALGLFESLKGVVAFRLRGQHTTWLEQIESNMPWWYGWALLTPLVLLVPRRFPLDAVGRRRRNAAAHAAAAVVLASLHLWIVGVGWYNLTPELDAVRARYGIHTFWQFLGSWHQSFLVANTITCATIMGAYYAVSYYRRFRETELQAARLEHRMSEARLHALRMELNPHFLFNTLNAIAGLVRRGERDAAVTVLARLGDLLRATLDRGLGPETPLAQELAMLETYLDIERARFGDRLTVRVHVPSELGDALVPSLLLQPVVENAVRHGVAQRAGPGAVDVRAWADDGRLTVEVRDTGPGIPPNGSLREGVGLSNTRARLAQLHGTAAGLALANGPEGGAVARLWMPLRQE